MYTWIGLNVIVPGHNGHNGLPAQRHVMLGNRQEVVLAKVVHVVEFLLKQWIVQQQHAQVLISDTSTLSCNTTLFSYMYLHVYVYKLIMTTTQQE
jgi:S-ribosylhomocysteine lyase LuxS involved in autoinducer biosynthesis